MTSDPFDGITIEIDVQPGNIHMTFASCNCISSEKIFALVSNKKLFDTND